MSEAIYRQLCDHLDRLPGGFAPSENEAAIRLLQLIFTPQEAALAVQLTVERQDAAAIAARAGLPVEETRERLEAMAHKGLIMGFRQDAGTGYVANPWIVGIFETLVNRLTPEMLQALGDYWQSQKRRPRETGTQQRVIPINESITPHLEALPYEVVNRMVDSAEHMAVQPCICRRLARLDGRGCDVPEESCLVFGPWAEAVVRHGTGRAVSREEMRALLAQADAHNLVLQPSNSQELAFICCCCSCCCGWLSSYKHMDKPAERVSSAFIAALDADACAGCWTCLERCQMGALSEQGDRVALNRDRCIGCGLCVTTCPSNALTLERKQPAQASILPHTLEDTWHLLARERAKVL
jgi:Na+-translocating ferredoxin:NAD+ oxidoreductase RNF subunit RnfB